MAGEDEKTPETPPETTEEVTPPPVESSQDELSSLREELAALSAQVQELTSTVSMMEPMTGPPDTTPTSVPWTARGRR